MDNVLFNNTAYIYNKINNNYVESACLTKEQDYHI
jgi:hypothetical protein